MPRRVVDEMTVSALNKAVRAIEDGKAKPRLIRVGGVGGLSLSVRMRSYASGEAISASWVLRRTFEGKRRDFALGPWPDVTLSQARERARGVMDKLWAGIDPKTERRAKTSAPTFLKATQEYFNRTVRPKNINARDEAKWFNDLETFVFPVIGDLPVDRIETAHILEITQRPHVRYGSKDEQPLWEAVPERARRCIKKVEAILNAATRMGHRSGDNPALWQGHLRELLPDPKKVRSKGNYPALPYAQLPAFMAALRSREASISSRALEFLILTGARSGEVRGATWSEIDMDARMWTIPGHRMKGGVEHRVPLPDAAMVVLKASPRFANTDLIWPGRGVDNPMSDATTNALAKKMHAAEVKAGRSGWVDPASGRPATPHGFRSTFRVWVTEQTSYPYEMAEMAIAHKVGTSVERAYNRTDMVEKRRAMMEDWAEYALSKTLTNTNLRVVS